MDIEKAFEISIPDADATTLYTVGDLQRYIIAACIAAGRRVVAEEVWTRLCDILEHNYGIQRRKITPTARIVADLGLD